MSGKRAKTLRKKADSKARVRAAAAVDVESTARRGPKSLVESTADNPRQEPGVQLAPVGPHPTLPGRNARGRFAADNDGHTSIGVFSKKKWAALGPMLHDERVSILQSKGFTEADADPVMVRVVDALNQSVVMMNSYFDFIVQTNGPISAKGRQKRCVEGWSRAADRVAKFAAMLGLEKRARVVHQSPAEWLAGLADANDEQEQEETTDDNAQADEPARLGQTEQTEAATDVLPVAASDRRTDADEGTDRERDQDPDARIVER